MESLRQGSYGDCYLVAWFQSLRQSPFFETIIRTSIKVFRNWEKTYFEVTIPLGKEKGKVYKVPYDIDWLVKWPRGFRILENVYLQLPWNDWEWWHANEAIKMLFGDFVSIGWVDNKNFETILDAFDPYLYTLNPSCNEKSNARDIFLAWFSFSHLIWNHSYTVQSVDRENKTVILNSPWNTGKIIKVSYEKFKKFFSTIGVCSYDFAYL